MPILVYRLDTSCVVKLHLAGSWPKTRNCLIKSGVSRLQDGIKNFLKIHPRKPIASRCDCLRRILLVAQDC